MAFLELFNPITTIVCFATAITLFRKQDVPIGKVLFPFMTSLYSPSRMKKEIRTEGILLIVLGYLSVIVWMIRL